MPGVSSSMVPCSRWILPGKNPDWGPMCRQQPVGQGWFDAPAWGDRYRQCDTEWAGTIQGNARIPAVRRECVTLGDRQLNPCRMSRSGRATFSSPRREAAQ